MEYRLSSIVFSLSAKLKTAVLTLLTLAIFSLFANTSDVQAYEDGWTLSIPSQGINAPIVPVYIRDFGNGVITWDVGGLNMQVGYLDGTAWFGQGGTTILGGHSVLNANQPDIFYHLDDVVVGDSIVVSNGGAERHYQVTDVRRISETDLSMFNPSSGERLILFTCDTNTYDRSTRSYSGRIMVTAVPA